jgi:hypothetical protein
MPDRSESLFSELAISLFVPSPLPRTTFLCSISCVWISPSTGKASSQSRRSTTRLTITVTSNISAANKWRSTNSSGMFRAEGRRLGRVPGSDRTAPSCQPPGTVVFNSIHTEVEGMAKAPGVNKVGTSFSIIDKKARLPPRQGMPHPPFMHLTKSSEQPPISTPAAS